MQRFSPKRLRPVVENFPSTGYCAMNRRPQAMVRATRLTAAGRLAEATGLLQRMLRGKGPPDPQEGKQGGPAGYRAPVIDAVPEMIEVLNAETSQDVRPTTGYSNGLTGTVPSALPDWLHGLLDQVKGIGSFVGTVADAEPIGARDLVPEGGQFIARCFSN